MQKCPAEPDWRHFVNSPQCRSSLSAAADGLADGSGVTVSVEPRLSTALKDRSAVPRPYSSPKDCSPSPPHVDLPPLQQSCLCTSRRDACGRISAIQASVLVPKWMSEPAAPERVLELLQVHYSVYHSALLLLSKVKPALQCSLFLYKLQQFYRGRKRGWQ